MEPSSSITTGTFSPFRNLRKASAVHVRWTGQDSYLSFSQKFSSLHFLALAKLHSTAQVGITKDTQLMKKKVDCVFSLTAFSLTLRSKAIVRSSSLRMLRSRIFNLRKVVLLRYRFCCVRQSVSGISFAHGFLVDLGLVGAYTSNETGLSEPKYS